MIIADTPWYSDERSGLRMLEERRALFIKRYGFPSDELKSLEYLTDQRLARYGTTVSVSGGRRMHLITAYAGNCGPGWRNYAADAQTVALPNLRRQGHEMIILFHPRATKPRNCRLPLAVLALAAVLEGREEYRIIDGNLEDDPTAAILSTIDTHQVELLGVSCMPGPQMVAAMETSPRDTPPSPTCAHCLGRILPFSLS